MREACFHCGLAVVPGLPYGVHAQGRWQPVCCAGCEAVAGSILGLGLDDYYRLRELPGTPGAVQAPAESELALYDDPLVQQAFVREWRGAREALLLVEGIRCAACAWLIEQALPRLPGVIACEVDYGSHRTTVRWDPSRAKLSAILAALSRLGYGASPFDPRQVEPLQRAERRDALWRLFVAGFGMMQVMMYALPAYLAGDGEMSADIGQLMRWASFVLTVPVVGYSAAPFFAGAWRSLAARRAGMDLPIALGIALAFAASLLATVSGEGEVYYDSVAMFVFALLLGRYLELLARQRAARSLQHLGRLVPEFAHRLGSFPQSMNSERVAAAVLRPGDHVLVKPGERFPADGVIEQGSGSASEALLSGESRPVAKAPGSAVTGGAINGTAALVMRVQRTGVDTVLSSIVRLVEHAAGEKPRLVELADRSASAFILMVIALAACAGVYWAAVEPSRAVLVAVSVLVATCPCALSLATPAALTAATGELARRGVIIARRHALEALASVDDFVFDKTGTLTRGVLRLAGVRTHGALDASSCGELAAVIESCSEHPIARALSAAATHARPAAAGEFRNVPGEGIEADIGGQRYRLGTRDFASALYPARVKEAQATGATIVWLWGESGPLASFELADELRQDAAATVAALQNLGIRVHLLSGDGQQTAKRVAAALGVSEVRGGATPERKLEYLRALRGRGRKVAMVGDGINDAPVLALADVSFAMAGGARLAQLRADAVLLEDAIGELPAAVRQARRTLGIIRQNVVWAFAYNLLVLPLALAGLLTPWAAALGMSASSLLVVVNALRLQRVPGS
jgi:Cu2+-exporting ATPase